MTQPLKIACALVLLPAACGGRTITEGDTDGETESSSSSSEGGSVTVGTTMTTTASTTMSTTDPATTDPTTTDPTGDTTAADSSTGGGGDGCCDVHAAAGCEEPDVEQCVCAEAADCCVFGWEKNCVDLAMNMCDATCMGDESSSGGSESTGEPAACREMVVIELEATDATLSGEWALVMSMLGEGMVAAFDFQNDDPMTDDLVAWDIDIPCDADWYIWVRGLDSGEFDSFYAQLDDAPDPSPIFELDCTGGGDGYIWTVLNQRDPMDDLCEYVEDPWIAAWSTGLHTLELEDRESPAVARIVITNDEAYEPM